MYKYFNPNPKNNNANDCVVRALCKVLDKSWDDVYDLLWEAGKKEKEIPTTNYVWESLLESYGFHRETLSCATNCPTVRSFATRMANGSQYVLCSGSHVVAAENGDYFDAYDSGDTRVLYYYFRYR